MIAIPRHRRKVLNSQMPPPAVTFQTLIHKSYCGQGLPRALLHNLRPPELREKFAFIFN
jgi:hypothetical protein